MKPLYQVRCTLWVLAESRAQALDLADDFLQQNAPGRGQVTRHLFEPLFYSVNECHECGEPHDSPEHFSEDEECPDCGNLLVTHSDDHPCPNPPMLDPRDG